VLEVAANPYVTILGPPESSERRLNLAQSFNAVGAVVTPFIGRVFILSGIEYSASQLSAMTPEQSAAYSAMEASRVRGPYLAITALFLFVAALLYFAHLPEIQEVNGETGSDLAETPRKHWEIWRYKHLVKGVVAQFFYVGAQVGVTSFVIRLTQHTLPNTPERVAANFLQWHLIGFMVGRFAGSAMMKRIAPPRLLGFFAVCAFICTLTAIAGSGAAPVWAVVFLGFFDSIMFPTIFALSVKNLGIYTKLGSALLVMSIIGGAILPAVMGYLSDASSIQKAFVVPLICYAYVLYFAVRGYKPAIPSEI
jgi:FHS family L-fucose permease-like MFS transporter